MIFGMNFNSLNPKVIEKEALKQVCSVVNGFTRQPCHFIYQQKKYLPFQSGLKPTTVVTKSPMIK